MSKHQNVFVSEEELQEQAKYSEKVKKMLQQQYGDYMPIAHVHSYGCQQNVSDGEKIKGMLALMGYGFSESTMDADLVIYNTCAVRENAEDRVFGNVGALKHNKKRRKGMLIGLCGCMMQQEHIVERLKKSFPYVDLIFGTHVLHRLPELLYRTIKNEKRVFETPQCDGVIAEHLPIQRDGNLKAWVPIMYGCNNFCTYCIVPYVRGRERSRASQEILDEVKKLISDGFKEITLLGQNVNSYGKGLDEAINFSELLRKIDALDGDFRIRFMTSHPKDATKELIDTIAECSKICHHLHLPVQSGSDRILKAMNRHYNIESYLELVEYAKNRIPDISFTSDIIVGFPGETREDFLKTMDLVHNVKYDSLFTFIYSKRVGTKAAEMDDPTPPEDKTKWLMELLEEQRKIGEQQLSQYVGKTIRVLADGPGKTGEDYITGRTEQNIIVDFVGSTDLIGEFVDVKITKALNWALLGEMESFHL